jgi:tRNA pseudouridine55 synthase
VDGALLIDKPAGPTSHDIVAGVRRELPKGTKVGHAGTLDPFATGLLIVLTGRATRAQRFLMGLPKSYETVARLGWTSSTGDPEGELVETRKIPPDPPQLPTGRLMQRPPQFSAVKVDGKRAYESARKGEQVEIAEREVEVTRFEQIARKDDRATFAIDCSSGTYVRSLISDLNDAYCLELRRTKIGDFSVGDADPAAPLSLTAVLSAVLETRKVKAAEAHAIAHGRTIEGEAAGPLLIVHGGEAVAIAEQAPDGLLKPVVGFRG